VVSASALFDHFLGRFAYAPVFAFVGIESMGIPFTGETILISAALYAGATYHLNIAVVIVAAAGGAIIGDNIGFVLGHCGVVQTARPLRALHQTPSRAREAGALSVLAPRRQGRVLRPLHRSTANLRCLSGGDGADALAAVPHLQCARWNHLGHRLWEGAYLAGDHITKLSRPVDVGLVVVASWSSLPSPSSSGDTRKC
jgi:hypothetical protein